MTKTYLPEAPTPELYDRLRAKLWRGATVYAIRRYDSPNGVNHHLSVVIVIRNQIVDITVAVARVTGRKLTSSPASPNRIVVRGGGLDPVNAIGCDLSAALWGDSYALTARTL